MIGWDAPYFYVYNLLFCGIERIVTDVKSANVFKQKGCISHFIQNVPYQEHERIKNVIMN